MPATPDEAVVLSTYDDCREPVDGTPDGAHVHLEENNGLEEGYASLVSERCDDE
ncbi:hypothetical protein [Streptomyces mirabilis]